MNKLTFSDDYLDEIYLEISQTAKQNLGNTSQSKRADGSIFPKKKKKQSVLQIVSTILCIVFLLGSGVLAFVIRSNREGMIGPSVLGVRFFKAMTSSMSPAITPGALMIVKGKEADKIEVGDILTFRADSSWDTAVTHRVVEIGTGGVDGEIAFITKGDANDKDDPNPVTTDRLLGTVVFWLNGMDKILTPSGLAAAVLVVLILFYIIPFLVRIITREEREEREE